MHEWVADHGRSSGGRSTRARTSGERVRAGVSTAESLSRPAWSGRILAIAQRGDRAAFAELFEHFAPRVKSYCYGWAPARSWPTNWRRRRC